MTVLIRSGNRQCSSACHYARFSVCRCVCGGRYHGRGIDGSLVEKVHETGDQFLDYLEQQGCDVAELRAAKKGKLAEQLEAERKAWLARKPGARTRTRRARTRSRRTRDDRQGRLDFSVRDAILGRREAGLEDRLCEEISEEEDGQAADPGRDAAGRQDGAGKGCLDNG